MGRGSRYTVRAGDSWFKIAGQVYGDQRYAEQLAMANGDVDVLQPGMLLRLPRPRANPTISPYAAQQWGMSPTGIPGGQAPGAAPGAAAPAAVPPMSAATAANVQAAARARGREGGLLGDRLPAPAPGTYTPPGQAPTQTGPLAKPKGGVYGGRRYPATYGQYTGAGWRGPGGARRAEEQAPPVTAQAVTPGDGGGAAPVYGAPPPGTQRPENYIPPGYTPPPLPAYPKPKQQPRQTPFNPPTYNWQRQYQRPWDVRNVELLAQGQYPYTIPQQDVDDYGINPLLLESGGYQYVPEARLWVQLNPAGAGAGATANIGNPYAGGPRRGGYGGGGRGRGGGGGYNNAGSRYGYQPISGGTSYTGRAFDPSEIGLINWRI